MIYRNDWLSMSRFWNNRHSRVLEIIPDFLMNWIAVAIGYGASRFLIIWNLRKSLHEGRRASGAHFVTGQVRFDSVMCGGRR